MVDITDSDLIQGKEVRWYHGGEAVVEAAHTVTAGEVSAGGFALADSAVADYGSVVAQVTAGGTTTVKAIVEYKTNTSTVATEALGCDFVAYTGMAEGDVVELKYVRTDETALTHCATSRDISFDASAEKKSAAVHGQSNKITSVGTVENSATMEAFVYDHAFIAAFQGDNVTGAPTTGMQKYTTAWNSFRKVGCLVGKKLNAAGTVVAKYFLVGCTADKSSKKFPTDDFYSESFSMTCDYYTQVDLVA
jgi:hypothetical protein